MLRHLSQFNLKYSEGDPEYEGLLDAMYKRACELPEAKEVKIYRQIDPSNPFDYCIEVTFPGDDLETLEKYMENPIHDAFCEEVWYKYVKNQLNLNILSLFE